MSLYCLKCKKIIEITNKKCKCDPRDLVSVTDNMLPVALIADSLGLQVASVFCLTSTHKKSTSVEAGVFFKCIYPDVLLQDLPTVWYWSDYISMDGIALCSCLDLETEFSGTGAMSLDDFIEGIINNLLRYLETFEKGGLQSVLTLLES